MNNLLPGHQTAESPISIGKKSIFFQTAFISGAIGEILETGSSMAISNIAVRSCQTDRYLSGRCSVFPASHSANQAFCFRIRTRSVGVMATPMQMNASCDSVPVEASSTFPCRSKACAICAKTLSAGTAPTATMEPVSVRRNVRLSTSRSARRRESPMPMNAVFAWMLVRSEPKFPSLSTANVSKLTILK